MVIEVLAALAGAVGAAASLYIAMVLEEMYKISDDVGYRLSALGFLVFAGGLAVEAAGHVLAPYFTPKCLFCRSPLLALKGHQLCLLANSIYLVAYTLYFSGLYVSRKQLFSMIPFVFMLLGEQSFLIVILLIISFLYSTENKNWRFTLFFLLLLISHVLTTVYVFDISAGLTLFHVAFFVRSLAPMITVCAARCRR